MATQVVKYIHWELPVVYKVQVYNIKCEVVEGDSPNILLLNDSVRLNLVKHVNYVSNPQVLKKRNVEKKEGVKTNKNEHENIEKCEYASAKEIIHEYKDVFQGMGKMPGKVCLKYDPTVPPVANPPHPIPAALENL